MPVPIPLSSGLNCPAISQRNADIVGTVVVIAHGYERFTKDLELVIGLERETS